MEKEEYEIMFNIEEKLWWYRGLRDLLFAYVKKENSDNLKLLDAGCGTGKFLELCKNYKTYGLDFSPEAIKFSLLRKLKNIVRASVTHIPFSNNFFNIVTSMDVLCHMSIEDDRMAIKEFYRVLNKDGLLILNLPAYDFLKSTHDKAVHTKHRYNKKELKEKLEEAGFKIEKLTYRNFFLFPLAFIMRFLKKLCLKKTDKTKSDLNVPPEFINKIFFYILFVENMLIKNGINLPAGLSIFCVARKGG